MGAIRPMPVDFAAYAWELDSKQLQAKYHAGYDAVKRWRKELGGDPRRNMGVAPADFAEQCKTNTVASLRRIYDASEKRIKAWMKQTGASPALRGDVKRPAPDDFAQVAPTMIQTALKTHYRADSRTVLRWIAETGIKAAPHVPDMAKARAARKEIVFLGHSRQQVHRDLRQMSIYDEAADIIRRERFAVNRCDERGIFDEKGVLWRVGNTILTPDELLARADRYRRRAA